MPVTKEEREIMFGPGPGITPEERELMFDITPKGDSGTTPSVPETAPAVTPPFLQQLFPPGLTESPFVPENYPIRPHTAGQLQTPMFPLVPAIVDAADILDKPRRVLTNAMYYVGQETKGVRLPKGQRRFESFKDAMKGAWTGEEAPSFYKSLEVLKLGEVGSNQIEAYQSRHWFMKYPRKATEFASDIVADAAVDYLLGKAIYRPLKAGFRLIAPESFIARVSKTPASVLDEGFEATVGRAVNDELGTRTTARVSTDDMIRESMMKSGELPEPIMQASVEEIAQAQTMYIAREAKRNVLADKVGILRDQLDNYDDYLGNAYDKWVKESRLKVMEDQLATQVADVDASKRMFTELSEKGILLDYTASRRAMRQAYVNAYIKKLDDPEAVGNIKHFIKLASGNTTDDIAELSDDAFQTLFDFIEYRVTDKRNWDYLSEGTPGTRGRFRRIGRRLVHNQVVSPAWQVFERLRGKRIYQFVDDAFYNRYTHLEGSLTEWDNHLRTLKKQGHLGKKRDETMRKIFLLADGRLDKVSDTGFIIKLKKGDPHMPGLEFAQETLFLSAEEQAAGEFINKEARTLADMAVAQGRLSHTGEGAPKVIKNYITHLFDRSADQAEIIRKDALRIAESLPAGQVRDDAIKAAELGAFADVADIAEMYQYKTGTKVDIPEFKRRIGAFEGLIEDADLAFRHFMNNETKALYMQPAYEAANTMAHESGNRNLIQYTRQWINSQRGIPTKIEAGIEPLAQDISMLLEYGLKWLPEWTHLQWKAENRAVRQFSNWFRAKTYFAAMGFNPGPVATNATQSMLTIGAIGTKSTFMGFQSLSSGSAKDILKHSRLLVGRNPMHIMNLREMSKAGRAGGWAFRQVDQWMNVAPAFNGSLYKQIAGNSDKMAVLRKYGIPEGDGFWKSLSKALDDGQFTGEVDIANRVAKLTQYSYLHHDMPQYLSSAIGKALGQFTSWPANYWTSYLPEMAKWMYTGNAPWGKLNMLERATLLRHVVLAQALLEGGKLVGIDFSKHSPLVGGLDPRDWRNVGGLPIPLPGGPVPSATGGPAMTIIAGAVSAATAKEHDRSWNEGISQMQRGFLMKNNLGFLPDVIPFFPQAARRAIGFAETGDFPSLIFRRIEEDEPSGRRTPYRPPGVPGLLRPPTP